VLSALAVVLWELGVFGLASLSDANCSLEDCSLAVTLIGWAIIAPALVFPLMVGYWFQPPGFVRRSVKLLASTVPVSATAIVLAAYSWLGTRSSGASVRTNGEIVALLIVLISPAFIALGYLLVGLGSAYRRSRVSSDHSA
jgi:hypothetical protein